VVQVDRKAVVAGSRAGSGLQLFIPGTGPSLEVFIVAGQTVTEITRTGDAGLVAWL
jgi:hypothetical protein